MSQYHYGPHKRYSNAQSLAMIAKSERHFGRLSGVLTLLKIWHARWSERRRMARDMTSFGDAVFNDLGITRQEARHMVQKPFWRA